MADNPTDVELSALPGMDVEAVVQAMIADGVDVADQAAVHAWLADSGGVSAENDDPGEDDLDLDDDLELGDPDEFDADGISFKEAFGLPDRLPPLRLPSDEQLAESARVSRMLGTARRLAEWFDGRAVTADVEPVAADCVAAAQALDIDAPPTVERLDDIPELAHLWDLADSVELVEVGEDTVTTGPAFDLWPGGSDEDVLDIWSTALAVAMTSLELDADVHDEQDLDFSGAGGAVLVTLFLVRGGGLPFGEVTELIREMATGEAPARAWDAWVATHGDPARILLTRLHDLGAVTLDEEAARLTPLGLWAMWSQLVDNDVEVPILPPVRELTAQELVAAAEGFTEEELAGETEAWLALRGEEAAARELLDAAAAGEPADRMYATSVVTGRLGGAAGPHWRAALDDPRLRAYAKLALGLKPDSDDLAWLLTDVLAATSEVDGPQDIAAQLSETVPAGQEQEIFELMWRLPHPWAAEVLTMIGAHHPDKNIAKAARKAAFKAASHNG